MKGLTAHLELNQDNNDTNKVSALGSLKNERRSSLQDLTWLDTSEAARYLRKSRGAIYNLIYRGFLTPGRVGRKLLFKRHELDRLIEKSR